MADQTRRRLTGTAASQDYFLLRTCQALCSELPLHCEMLHQPHEPGPLIAPILEERKLRLRG